MCEIWKDVPEYEGFYQASSFGRIRSVDRVTSSRFANGKILKQSLQNSGYRFVRLSKNGKTKSSLVHRVIAKSFLELVKGKTYVNHKDGDKQNNNINNLEWCSFSENIKHSYGNGNRVVSDKSIKRLISFNKKTKSKPIKQFTREGVFIKSFISASAASAETGINYSGIRKSALKIKGYPTCGGYVWEQ